MSAMKLNGFTDVKQVCLFWVMVDINNEYVGLGRCFGVKW